MKEAVSGCPLEEAMRVLGGRWRIVLVYYLLEGRKRFSELRRLMPEISQRMLTLDLRGLEQAGLVKRTVYPEVPVRVEYELSEEGLRLKPLVDLMGEVGERLSKSRTCAPGTRHAA
jgi:DNA-binding HxlR family transcriptional regulator